MPVWVSKEREQTCYREIYLCVTDSLCSSVLSVTDLRNQLSNLEQEKQRDNTTASLTIFGKSPVHLIIVDVILQSQKLDFLLGSSRTEGTAEGNNQGKCPISGSDKR